MIRSAPPGPEWGRPFEASQWATMANATVGLLKSTRTIDRTVLGEGGGWWGTSACGMVAQRGIPRTAWPFWDSVARYLR